MKELLAWFDTAPKLAKIILSLPGIDLIWALYRIFKGIVNKKVGTIVLGVLWIIFASFTWIIDLVFAILDKPLLFTED